MTLQITEIQITCAVLMMLLAQLFLFGIPRLGKTDAITTHARHLLSTGIMLIAIHFTLQYLLHKNHFIIAEFRTTLNLAFGLAFAYCFNVSLLYLQRKGNILRKEYRLFAASFILAFIVLCIALVIYRWVDSSVQWANLVLALCMAFTQIYANYLQIKEYRFMRKFLREGGQDGYFTEVIHWTRWSMYCMAFTGVLLPLMAFMPNLTLRGLYGILSLSAGHFYIFSFLGYQIKHIHSAQVEAEDTSAPKKRYETSKLQQISEKMPQLEKEGIYLMPHLTQGELAERLGVSSHILSHYFQNTAYGKFTTWMQHNRIAYAKKLLYEHPDWSNQTISQACGYCNRNYFQAQFVDCTGMSPLKWAEQHTESSQKEV